MNSTPNPTSTADDVLAARADQRLAHAYEQITLADEQLARVTAQLSRLEGDGARQSSALPLQRTSHGRSLLRGLAGLVLAAGIGVAAFAAQTPYGEPARLMIAQWAPQLFSTSLAQSGTPATAAQSISPSVQLAAAEATPSQPVPPSQTPEQNVAPAPLPPELTLLLQTMAHDIAVVQQGIEQLKASQERMIADNARTLEQLKASQDQLTRVAAKPSENKPSENKPSENRPSERSVEKPPERDLRAKTTGAAPPRLPTVANAARKPPPTQAPQARAHSQPVQLQPDEQ